MHQFNHLKKNLNATINFQQIEIYLIIFFDYLLFAKAILKVIDFLPLVGLFKIDNLFSPKQFDLKNLLAALKEIS